MLTPEEKAKPYVKIGALEMALKIQSSRLELVLKSGEFGLYPIAKDELQRQLSILHNTMREWGIEIPSPGSI